MKALRRTTKSMALLPLTRHRRVGGPSLAFIFLCFSIVVIGLPLAGSILQTVTAVTRDSRTQLDEKNMLLARSIAREAGVFLEGYFGALKTLASEPEKLEAQNLISAFPAFAGIMLVDPTGRVRLSAGSEEDVGYDVSQRDYFKEAANGRPYLSLSSLPEQSYHPTVHLSLAYPGASRSASSIFGYCRIISGAFRSATRTSWPLPTREERWWPIARTSGWSAART